MNAPTVSGPKAFYVNTDPSLSGHDSLFDMRTIGYDESTVTTRVTCTTIDEFCEAKKISSIDLLKLDVEGHEYTCCRARWACSNEEPSHEFSSSLAT